MNVDAWLVIGGVAIAVTTNDLADMLDSDQLLGVYVISTDGDNLATWRVAYHWGIEVEVMAHINSDAYRAIVAKEA